MLSVIEVWVDYSGVNVFHSSLDFGIVYAMVLGFVSMSVVLYVVCFLRMGVVYCVLM